MSIRRRLSALALLALIPLVISATAESAHAQSRYISHTMINHTKTTDVTDYKHRLGICKAESSATNCSISKGRTSTRTIQTSLGVSKGWVAGKLDISSSSSVTVTVGCSSVKIKAGYKLEAFPVGSKHKYKIRKKTIFNGKTSYETSGWKYTYNPYQAGIACKISKS